MPIPIAIKSKPITIAVTDMIILTSFFSSKNLTLTSKFLNLVSPLLFFHRHSYVPTSFVFPFNDKTDVVLLSLTVPGYCFPF
jgi:hypothetical protein